MSKAIKIRKGLDIRLEGEAETRYGDAPHSDIFAIKPPDFLGTTPKLRVKAGDKVKAGTPLFHEKSNDTILFAAPVSGEVIDVIRGEKRRIMEVKIKADATIQFEDFGAADINAMDRQATVEKLLSSGCWPFIRERPFSGVANPNVTPKCIVVPATDTHPLAPYNDFIVEGKGEQFQMGLDVLAKLSDGPTYLTMVAGKRRSDVFLNAQNCEVVGFSGPHPAGNVSTQIHQLDPIDKGDHVWYVGVQDVIAIGQMFLTGHYDASRIVALTGSEVKNPQYYETYLGGSIAPIVENNIVQDNVRYVSGNPLTGTKIPADGYIGFYDSQITVLPEGDEYKFVLTKGWMGLGFDKFSASKAFPTQLLLMTGDDPRWRLDTNSNGEERAFVVTGQYEEVFPFDIFPVQLVKACVTNDIDGMEKLGIYEIDAEDFALCEYVCTSKIDTMHVVREGLKLVKEECF